ncbi:MAG TPA: N-acetyltransferase [Devosia sp.]|nr:N-acetyltransferase [Devosia sp.]
MNLTLATERLLLRSPLRGDAARLAGLLNNYAVASNLAHVKLPHTTKDTELWLPRLIASRAPEQSGFVIIMREAGVVGLVSFRRDGDATILGYWLGEEFWGRGIMSEAVTGALKWYFTHSKTDIVTSGVFHFNMASLAIQHKMGFVETGRSVVRCLARNADIEHIDTELTRQAFEDATK